MLYQTKVSDAFGAKVQAIAADLGVNPDWLMWIMNFETGGTFDPSLQNSIGATGLIQFLPATASDLNTTTTALKGMSDISQLDYVKSYFQKKIAQYGTPKSVSDAYLLVFYPAAINYDLSAAFPDNVYNQNKGLDYDGNGYLTKSDIVDFVNSKYQGSATSLSNFFNTTTSGDKSTDSAITKRKMIAVVSLLLAISLFSFAAYHFKKSKK